MFKFNMGDKAKDIITGFDGFITCRIEFITGCNQYVLQPRVDKAGNLKEPQQFDENRLELVKTKGRVESIKIPNYTKSDEPGGAQKKISQHKKIKTQSW